MNNEEMVLKMLGDIKGKLDEHDHRFERLETDISDLKDGVRYNRVLIEQQDHKISLIAEQYTDIAENWTWQMNGRRKLTA